MTGGRVGAITLAAVMGMIFGGIVTDQLQGGEVAAQSGGRRVIRPGSNTNTGLPFSPGILVGNTLYLAGALGTDPATGNLAPGGIEGETRQTLVNLGNVLKAAGMGYQDVTTVTAYLTNLDDFNAFNKVYGEFFPKDPPARTTVQVAGLVRGAKVELQMTAVRP